METETNQPPEMPPSDYVIVVGHPRNPMNGKYLKGPTDASIVKKWGYAFTADVGQAWPFPSEAQAEAKAAIVDRHMAWGDGVLMVEPKPQHDCSAFFAALMRMQARGQTRLSANCLAAEMWPNARHQNSNGQSFNLAAGVAGRMLRKYRACHEVRNRVWEIVPEFLRTLVEARRK